MTAEFGRQVERVTRRRHEESMGDDREPAWMPQPPKWSQQPDLHPRLAAFALFAICFVTLGGAAAYVVIWMTAALG